MKLPQYDNRQANTPLYDPNFGKNPLSNEKDAMAGLLAIVGVPVCLGLVAWSLYAFVQMILGH